MFLLLFPSEMSVWQVGAKCSASSEVFSQGSQQQAVSPK